jgi:hypothetical protein
MAGTGPLRDPFLFMGGCIHDSLSPDQAAAGFRRFIEANEHFRIAIRPDAYDLQPPLRSSSAMSEQQLAKV